MAIINSQDKLQTELIDLREEIKLLSPTDTPLTTIILGRGQTTDAKDITVTWREKELNPNRGSLILEGAEAGDPIKSSRAMKSNICQIIEKVTAITGTSNALRPNGIGDEFAVEINDRLTELKRDLEWYYFNGVYTLESEGTPRQMNGLFNLVNSANVQDLTAKGGELTEDVLLNGMQSVWEAGAQGEYYLFANATEKRIINNLLKNATSTRITATAGDNVMGVLVQKVETDFGVVNIVLNRHIPNGKIIGLDLSMVEVADLRGAFYEELAKTGDYKKGHVLAEGTIKLLNSKAGFVVKGISK